jgi:peptidoglycan/xylan/chitin deacetylase (PgdA/CDA1 family)
MIAPLRPAILAAMRSGPFARVLDLLEAADRGRHGTLAVLTYHRVCEIRPSDGYPGLVSADPATFDRQMAFLASHYRPVSLAEVLSARDGVDAIGPRSVMVTFDDAYRDFADQAWPILRRRGVPVTLFVPTAFPDDPGAAFWWDRLSDAIESAPSGATVESPGGRVRLSSADERRGAYRRLRAEVKAMPHDEAMAMVTSIVRDQLRARPSPSNVLGWSELRELASDGVTLAAHSRSHPLLTRVEDGRLRDEIEGSLDDLARELGEALPAFAYPSGASSPEVLDAAEAAGIRVGFTTRRGVNQLGSTDWRALQRINVGSGSGLNVLRAQLGRWARAWSH